MRGRPHLIPAGRAYVAIGLPRSIVGALEGVQRSVVAAVKRDGPSVEPLPRRALGLPLFDLGVVDIVAFEAIELALSRAVAAHAPFSVQLSDIDALAEGEVTVLRLMVDDAQGKLAALRRTLGEHLGRYGFPIGERPWRPHVPLARAGGLTEAPDIGRRPLGAVRVRQVGVWHCREDARGRWRFVSALQAPLGRAEVADEATAPDPEQARAAIAEALDARLTRRAEALEGRAARAGGRARRRRPRTAPADT